MGDTVQALVGDDAPQVDGIYFNTRLKYMLVRLKKGTTREHLEAIQPDFINLTAAVGKDRMSMAILTAECLTGQSLSLCKPEHHQIETIFILETTLKLHWTERMLQAFKVCFALS